MSRSPLTWLEIDLAAVRANVTALRSMVAPTTQFLAVVKSNAYGHGLIPVAQAAGAAGAEWLGVVAADEALELRAAGLSIPILVLGMTQSADWAELAAHDIRVMIADREQLAQLVSYRGPQLTIHLKVESGLGRLGFLPNEVLDIVGQLQHIDSIELEGISSHFASVEEQDLGYTARQLAEFERAVSQLDRPLVRHIAATAAILQLPETHLDLVRAGIGMYGLWPSEGVRQVVQSSSSSFQLRPALSWRAHLVQVKVVHPGTSVGYGRTHVVAHPTTVGVVPVGYADGYDRGLSNRTQVLIRGQRVPVIGRVAMNMLTVDLSGVADARVGDVVTLIGCDGANEVTADDLATWAETINYEIVTRIPKEMPRHFLQ